MGFRTHDVIEPGLSPQIDEDLLVGRKLERLEASCLSPLPHQADIQIAGVRS